MVTLPTVWGGRGGRLFQQSATYKDRKQKGELIEINGAMFDVTWTITFESVHIIDNKLLVAYTHTWVSAFSA